MKKKLKSVQEFFGFFIRNKNANIFLYNIIIDILLISVPCDNLNLIRCSEFENIIMIWWRKTKPHVFVEAYNDKIYFTIFFYRLQYEGTKLHYLEALLKSQHMIFFFYFCSLAARHTLNKLSDTNRKSFMNLDFKNLCPFITFSYL